MASLKHKSFVDALVLACGVRTAKEHWEEDKFVAAQVKEWRDALDAIGRGESIYLLRRPNLPKADPEPTLSIADLRRVAASKNATVTGTVGDYNVDAPDGYKWDGDLLSFKVDWSVDSSGKTVGHHGRKDKQDALKDAIERVNGATLEPYDPSEED